MLLEAAEMALVIKKNQVIELISQSKKSPVMPVCFRLL